ncbi:MAG: LamG domain-containing protein, partial [Planctomycetota bacterium]
PRCVQQFAPSMGSFRYLDHYAVAGSFRPDCTVDIYDLWSLSRDWLMSSMGDVTASSASTTGIVGHWALDDDVGGGAALDRARVLDDLASPLNHAYLYDGFTPADLPKYGVTGVHHTDDCAMGTGALTFDGFDDWITIPNAPNLNSNTVTVSAWVKPADWLGMWGTYPPIVASNEPNGFKICLGSKASYETGQEWMPNNELTYFWTGWAWDYHSGLIIPPDLWTFVALVVEPTKGTLYLYDSMKMSASTNYEDHEAKPFDNACFIGGHIDPNNPANNIYFTGLIDDVYFYGRALAPAEVLDLAGLSGTHHLGLEAWRPDADGDDTVNFDDYGIMADNWLKDLVWP